MTETRDGSIPMDANVTSRARGRDRERVQASAQDNAQNEDGSAPAKPLDGENGFTYREGCVYFAPPDTWQAPSVPTNIADAIRENRIVPTEERVLVWTVLEETSKGGIIIPETAKNPNRSFRAVIMALGPDARACGFEVGQTVIVAQYAGVMLPDRSAGQGGKPIDMIRAQDILALDYRGDA